MSECSQPLAWALPPGYECEWSRSLLEASRRFRTFIHTSLVRSGTSARAPPGHPWRGQCWRKRWVEPWGRGGGDGFVPSSQD